LRLRCFSLASVAFAPSVALVPRAAGVAAGDPGEEKKFQVGSIEITKFLKI
jgi:hypothetical protein